MLGDGMRSWPLGRGKFKTFHNERLGEGRRGGGGGGEFTMLLDRGQK